MSDSSLPDRLRTAIASGKLPPIFKYSDLKNAGIDDPNHNLSNHDKKNPGTPTVEKVLLSRKIGEDAYYTFDEKFFKAENINCNETAEGVRYYDETGL